MKYVIQIMKTAESILSGMPQSRSAATSKYSFREVSGMWLEDFRRDSESKGNTYAHASSRMLIVRKRLEK